MARHGTAGLKVALLLVRFWGAGAQSENALAAAGSTGGGLSARYTWNGCKCKQKWQSDTGPACDSYCCNPDDDASGMWCMVEDAACEDFDWGYCRHSSMTGNARCVDTPGESQAAWADNEGSSCEEYVKDRLCTATGGYGDGWDAEWGTFFDFTKDGKTAVEACCGCGGGTRSEGLAPQDMCTDIPSWKDKDGDDCSGYISRAWCNSSGYGKGWHDEWGKFSAFETAGQTAFTACCACGGGTRGGSDMLIKRTTWNGCSCKKSWQHKDGKTCEGYCCHADEVGGAGWCMVEDSSCEDFEWGYCRPLGALVAPGTKCADDPPGWTDTEGDTCDDYNDEKYCNDFGGYGPGWQIKWGTFHNFMKQQRTAATACCTCGGGQQVWQPTLALSCDDVADWRDKDGDDCAGYKTLGWCDENGQGAGWHPEWGSLEDFVGTGGLSAVEACCHCGGGSRSRSIAQHLEVGRQKAEVIVKEKPWVLPAGAVVMLSCWGLCCVTMCCVFRKHSPEEVADKAKEVAKEVKGAAKEAVGAMVPVGKSYDKVRDDL